MALQPLFPQIEAVFFSKVISLQNMAQDQKSEVLLYVNLYKIFFRVRVVCLQ